MSVLTVDTAMPPQVRFKTEMIEDRDATIAANEFVGIPVDIITVHPHGGKDFFEFIWNDWLERVRQQVSEDRFPRNWLLMIEQQYRAYKNNTPMPSFGTPIKDWQHSTPQVYAALKANNISTIEELATANEETIRRLGMGSRVLHQKAKQYIEQQPISTEEIIRKQLTEEDTKFSKAMQSKQATKDVVVDPIMEPEKVITTK